MILKKMCDILLMMTTL